MTASFRLPFIAALLGAVSLLPAATLAQTAPLASNILLVNYTNLNPSQLAGAQPLYYTVLFQNPGPDTATTVTVIDTLDATRLDPTTLQLLASSHNVTWQMDPNHVLNARFAGIQLPARATDSINSRGFLRFQVRPRPTLPPGDTIFNRAYVIFEPSGTVVPTNPVITVIGRPSGLSSPSAAPTWSAYPNPTTGALTVTADLPTAGPVQLTLLDLLGRSIQQHQLAAPAGAFRHPLEMAAVAPGLYVLRLQLPDGRVTTRQIVRR